jgi:dihydropteroate synthase
VTISKKTVKIKNKETIMEKLDNIKEVKVGEQQIEVDPRSKTSADKAYNYIGTGGPEEEVQGQGAVLAEKKRKSKGY